LSESGFGGFMVNVAHGEPWGRFYNPTFILPGGEESRCGGGGKASGFFTCVRNDTVEGLWERRKGIWILRLAPQDDAVGA